jgi:hypothetical protein
LQEQRVFKVVLQEHKVDKEYKALKALKEYRVPKAHRALKVHKVYRD